jgi:hypothetical protein
MAGRGGLRAAARQLTTQCANFNGQQPAGVACLACGTALDGHRSAAVVEALVLMANLADEIDAAIAQTVRGLRGHGYSWAEIGSRIGITRQGTAALGATVSAARATHDSDWRSVTVTPAPLIPAASKDWA